MRKIGTTRWLMSSRPWLSKMVKKSKGLTVGMSRRDRSQVTEKYCDKITGSIKVQVIKKLLIV